MRGRSKAFEWSSAAEAPSGLLEAARQVFADRGFSGSSIANAVSQAAGTGNYGGHLVPMDELFVALWARHQADYDEATLGAVAQARRRGVTDPGQLFETGARAYLQGSWHRRDLALLFSSGDAPPGFAALAGHRLRREWVRRNAVLLDLSDRPEDRLHAASLTSLIGMGCREVASAGNFRQAVNVIDAVIGYARPLITARPIARSHAEHR